MPIFRCENKDCPDCGKDDYQPVAVFKWNEKNERLEAGLSICPACGEFRPTIKTYKGWTNAWHKAENDRNYDNKKVKKYEYDTEKAHSESIDSIKDLL